MKRRKRMGMYKARANSARGNADTLSTHAHEVAGRPGEQAADLVPAAFESTPERFVAFVNRTAERQGFR